MAASVNNGRTLSEEEAIALLREAFGEGKEALSHVLAHSRKVREIALRIAGNIKGADREFVASAALLHDIGRAWHPPWKDSVKHGVKGAEFLRKKGLERYARVAERHLGGGITAEEIKKHSLGIPARDYLPETIEEKIIAYADKLAKGDAEARFSEVVERFREEVGEEAAARITRLRQELEELCLDSSCLGS